MSTEYEFEKSYIISRSGPGLSLDIPFDLVEFFPDFFELFWVAVGKKRATYGGIILK